LIVILIFLAIVIFINLFAYSMDNMFNAISNNVEPTV